MPHMEITVRNADEMGKWAVHFIQKLPPKGDGARLITLSGPLGAGKTTFVQAVARELGIEEMVASPTFILQKIYAAARGPFARLVHVDAYRLAHGSELLHLGWRELLSDPGNLILLEWPEKVADAVSADAMSIEIEPLEGERRKIIYGKENES